MNSGGSRPPTRTTLPPLDAIAIIRGKTASSSDVARVSQSQQARKVTRHGPASPPSTLPPLIRSQPIPTSTISLDPPPGLDALQEDFEKAEGCSDEVAFFILKKCLKNAKS